MSLSTTSSLIDEIIENEGRRYTNRPSDRGGPTKFGITLRTLSNWRGEECSPDDVKKLNEDEARQIYYQIYIVDTETLKLPEEIQEFYSDACVHHGEGNACRMLQRVINEAGFARLKVDGAIGPKTIAAANLTQEEMDEWFVTALAQERWDFCKDLIDRDPRQNKYHRGWWNRMQSFVPEELEYELV